MASQLTGDEVAHIAGLAQLELSASEVDLFARQLTDILAYAAIVQQIDAPADTSAGAMITADAAPTRADVPASSLGRDTALAQAPDADREAGLFRVPKVL
jgi:aspartyl-tRNA(Asn)/glutamyl-tRNA(Gln) amidotransferase subunit C